MNRVFLSLLTRFHNWEVHWFNVYFESFLDPGRLSLLTYVLLLFNSLDLGWCNLGYLDAKQRDFFFLFRILILSFELMSKSLLMFERTSISEHIVKA